MNNLIKISDAANLGTINVLKDAREQLIDITAQVARAVEQSGIADGVCHLFCQHTTAALTVNENADPDVKRDLLSRVAAVRRALAALPEELRVPLVLAEYEERSHAEIAEVLDCSAKAVEMRIYRARQQLRATLAGLLKDG